MQLNMTARFKQSSRHLLKWSFPEGLQELLTFFLLFWSQSLVLMQRQKSHMETRLGKSLKGKKKSLKLNDSLKNQQLPLMLTRKTNAELNRLVPVSGQGSFWKHKKAGSPLALNEPNTWNPSLQICRAKIKMK